MNDALQKLIDMSVASRDDGLTPSALREWINSSGFDGLTLLRLQGAATNYFGSHADDWQKTYIDNGFFRHDPVVDMARRHRRVVTWQLESLVSGRPAETKAMCKLAIGHGIRSGLTVSISIGFGRSAVFTLYSASASPPEIAGIDQILLASAVTHLHHSLRLNFADMAPPLLKSKEVQCLRWAAEGKSMREVARLEGLSYSTVRFFLDRAKAALGAVSLPQATALAKEFDLI